MKIYNDPYTIVSAVKGTTERGANYFEIEAVRKETGEIIRCQYFGNTTPKRLLDVVEKPNKKDPEKAWFIGVIQPHTSRDKKTGKFIGKRLPD